MTVLIGSRQPESLGTIKVDSPEWFAWLEQQKSFRFECSYTWYIQAGIADIKDATCTVIKQGKYWNAQKRVSGQLRRYYLGTSDKLTYDGLCEAAKTLAINPKWSDYLRAKQAPGVQSHKKETDLCETEHQATSQVSPPPEDFKETTLLRECLESHHQQKHVIEAYRSETEELKARITELEVENQSFKERLHFAEFQVDQKDTYIRELHNELLSRPHPADLIRKKVAELGMQEQLMQHQADSKKAVRYWALAKLLESLED